MLCRATRTTIVIDIFSAFLKSVISQSDLYETIASYTSCQITNYDRKYIQGSTLIYFFICWSVRRYKSRSQYLKGHLQYILGRFKANFKLLAITSNICEDTSAFLHSQSSFHFPPHRLVSCEKLYLSL